MPYLVVCPVTQIATVAAKHKPSHMLTVMSENAPIERPASVSPDNHKTLIFNDIAHARDGLVPPGQEHVEAILAFARAWDRQAPMLIHCYAGVSRSTASAFSIANALVENADPFALAQDLRFRSPTATPNPKIVGLADGLLGKDGAMVAAIKGIGRGADCFEGTPFVFPLSEDQAAIF
ncbi:MAG: tyrosine phosphatase family protein [Pseudomonadota bacterium]